MRTYSAYFSTQSTSNPASGPASQNKWQVNWRSIFGNRVGECRVRAKILSASNANLYWTGHVGTVRINFMSNTANSNQGLILGSVQPIVDSSYPSYASVYNYLQLDTTQSNGLSAVIPNFMNQSQTLIVSFYDANETLMVGVPDYQIWLYFDVEDDIPVQHNYEQCPVSFF